MHRALIPLISLALATSASAQITIKATNKLPLARASQTIEVSGKDLASLNARDLTLVHIKDSAGKEVLAQAVDTDYDPSHRADIVIFQADFAASESKSFTASVGAKQEYKEEDYKAHGRFVRERFDDFAWENDLIAHRTYGKGLATWKEEALISSTIDIWSKRTTKMVIDRWYMTDNYHADHGEGADFYSAGVTRGCGANGLWANNQLFVTQNFTDSRVLANGPIRVMFELDYDAFSAGGPYVAETKRVSLDAGSQLDRFQSFYKPYVVTGRPVVLTSGIGLKKNQGEQKEHNAEHAWLAKWERVAGNQGNQGMAVIVDPKTFTQQTEDPANHLMLVKADANHTVSYYAGFCWDKAEKITTFDAWKKYVDEFSQSAASPIEVSVAK